MDAKTVKNAMYREIQLESENVELTGKVDEDKFLYTLIKYHAAEAYQFDPLTIEKQASIYITIVDAIGKCTPRKFMQLFPIDKEYKGHKYGFKDYFSVMESINKIGLDNEIENGFSFLWDYLNHDTNIFLVNLMSLMNSYNQLQGKGDLITEFLKSQNS